MNPVQICDNGIENTSVGVAMWLIRLAALCYVRARLSAFISQRPERMYYPLFLPTLTSTQRVEPMIGVCYARTFLLTLQP